MSERYIHVTCDCKRGMWRTNFVLIYVLTNCYVAGILKYKETKSKPYLTISSRKCRTHFSLTSDCNKPKDFCYPYDIQDSVFLDRGHTKDWTPYKGAELISCTSCPFLFHQPSEFLCVVWQSILSIEFMYISDGLLRSASLLVFVFLMVITRNWWVFVL